jgi:GGDEF domain-containing protein
MNHLAERELRRRDGQPLGILLIDVDNFKRINERRKRISSR